MSVGMYVFIVWVEHTIAKSFDRADPGKNPSRRSNSATTQIPSRADRGRHAPYVPVKGTTLPFKSVLLTLRHLGTNTMRGKDSSRNVMQHTFRSRELPCLSKVSS